MKLKRILTMCLAALMTVGMVACGEKEKPEPNTNGNNGGSNGGDAPTSLADTYWYHVDGNVMTEGTVTTLYFEDESLCAFEISHYVADGEEEVEDVLMLCIGTYTYSAGSGNIHFTDTTFTQDMGNATFSISGNTLTLNYNGETYTLTKVSFPGDDPDPQPGDGDGINGTTWMYTYTIPASDPDEEDIVLMHNLTFAYNYCIYTFNDEAYETYQYMGTYTFSNGSGSASLADEEGIPHNATFNVSGNTLTFSCDGNTLTFEKQDYDF